MPGDGIKPNLFVVGAVKCGTTTLCDLLAQHPEICFSQRKEPIFFGSDLLHRGRTTSLVSYQDYFSHHAGEQIVAEGTVWYLYSQQAALEIKQFRADARIIAILRNPLDVIRSLHLQFLSSANEHLPVLADALHAQSRRKTGELIRPKAHFPLGLQYENVVRFGEQLARFVDVFGRDQVLVLFFDDLRIDPRESYQQALRFLDVQKIGYKAEYTVQNRTAERFVTRFGMLNETLRRPPAPARFMKQVTPKALKAFAKRGLRRINRIDSRLPRDLQDRVLKKLLPDIELVESITQRDLSDWKSVPD